MRMMGRNTSPWKRPKTTVSEKIYKEWWHVWHWIPTFWYITYPKHDSEPIVVWEGKQKEADKGGGATIEDGRAHLGEGSPDPPLAVARCHAKGMCNVHAVVHAEPDSEHKAQAGYGFNGLAEEVCCSYDVHL